MKGAKSVLVKVIVIQAILAAAVYLVVKDKRRRRRKKAEHLDRMNRIEVYHSQCVFRAAQAEIRRWNNENAVKANVNLVCKNPKLAGTFFSVIKGGKQE